MQTFRFRDYSFRPVDDIDLTKDDVPAQPPAARTTATREDVLAMILVSLNTPDSPLYVLIDNELEQPSERGRTPRVPPMDSIRASRGITEHIMDAIDQHAELPATGEG